MVEFAKEVLPIKIEDELKQSYLDYAMSVIVGRALPDVRDGLKPVHRRVLYAMHELGNDWNKPYKKSARVVGDVIGKYHPHGDIAVYDTIVRLAQPFSMRYCLIDGQGNFGSIDGDSAAAMRYTEVRMDKLAHQMLSDLEKDTVDFVPNYDESEMAPTVLPTRIPNLLVNGAAGIAVGMATNIPPHNLTEVIKACEALIDQPDLDIDQLIEYIPGPDFPTGALISGRAGIIDAYRTGKGRVIIRAKTHFETCEKTNKASIIVTEVPYQVNKARLIEKIAELVKDKKMEGISGLRDESDKDGLRVVIELKRHENPEVVLNNLYAQTQLQHVFGINMVALCQGQPKLLNLKDILDQFIYHRRVVVHRRTCFDLKKARDKAHLLEGLAVALANIDAVIQMIREAKNPQEAKTNLLSKLWVPGTLKQWLSDDDMAMARVVDLPEEFGLQSAGYQLTNQQAQAILDLKLHRLTGLEQDKIIEDYRQIIELIKEYIWILSDHQKLMSVVKEELQAVRVQFGDERRTEIAASHTDLTREDLIDEEDMVVTLSHEGYVKAQPLDTYQAQRRGGRGKASTKVKDEDFIEKLVIANTHDTILCFSSLGKVYWLKVYQLPVGNRTSRGRPIVNCLPLAEEERIQAICPLSKDNDFTHVFFATQHGVVKKVPLADFSRPRSSGIRAMDLAEDDWLVDVQPTDGQCDIMLFSDAGKVIRFHESQVRAMGRTARGVRGIRLADQQRMIALVVLPQEATGGILTATENGFGKRTDIEAYPIRGRGGQGVISIQTTPRNGAVISAIVVQEDEQAMLITDQGTLVRIRCEDVAKVGRNTQGVRLINLSNEEKLVGIQRIQAGEELEEDDAPVEDSPE